MPALKGFIKEAIEKKRFTVDYSCWLDEGETLFDYSIAISPPTDGGELLADGAAVDGTFKILTFYLKGGTPGYGYKVKLIATTNLGQVKSDTIEMRVV